MEITTISMLVSILAATAAWLAVIVQLLVGTNFFESCRKNCARKKLRSIAKKQARQLAKIKGSDPIEVLQERARNVYNFEIPFYVFEREAIEDVEIACIIFYLLFEDPVIHKPCEDKIFRTYHIHDGHLEDDRRSIFKTAADLLSIKGHWRFFNYFFSVENNYEAPSSLMEIAYSPDKTTSINRTDENDVLKIIELMLDPENTDAQKIALHGRNNSCPSPPSSQGREGM